MAILAVTSYRHQNAQSYVEAINRAGGRPEVFVPTDYTDHGVLAPVLAEQMGGLLLTGGPDVDPELYHETVDAEAGVVSCPALDRMEMAALRLALERDLPVLAICRGMQLLNVAFGGKLLQDVPGHRAKGDDGKWGSAHHSIYLAPGSKLAAILGTGGFFRVNSQHHQGLRDAQRSPRLLGSAYALDDGLIEALESPKHKWVVGVQCHPELSEEVPKVFANLFSAFVERVQGRFRG